MSEASKRARRLNSEKLVPGDIVYIMSRDQRVQDNWALQFALEQSRQYDRRLVVVFCYYVAKEHGQRWHHSFMLDGLKMVNHELASLGIPFIFSTLSPSEFVESHRPGLVVCDFSPLRGPRKWRASIAKNALPVIEVDAHNVVPAWVVTNKQEYSAATFRPKLQRRLDEYLVLPPKLRQISEACSPDQELLRLETTKRPQGTPSPGASAARGQLDLFINERLSKYEALRNDPNADVQSELSPYLHFGQLSAARAALQVLDSPEGATKSVESFLDELLVRRELSDNYCLFQASYDSYQGLPSWGQKTLEAHKHDPRENVYTYEEWEAAVTHDELWNSTQQQLIRTGRIPGYLRMYWAKKILEWSASPEEAVATAVRLNDAYELDGRDPNGYAGIAWSIGGLHDRPWFERPVYGLVRYMNAAGAARKFNVQKYIETWSPKNLP